VSPYKLSWVLKYKEPLEKLGKLYVAAIHAWLVVNVFLIFLLPVGVVKWAEWRKIKCLVKLAYRVRVELSRNVLDKI